MSATNGPRFTDRVTGGTYVQYIPSQVDDAPRLADIMADLVATVAKLKVDLAQMTQERDDWKLSWTVANDIIGKMQNELDLTKDRLTALRTAIMEAK